MSDSLWLDVTKAAPCEVCGKPDWCARAKDGTLCCRRSVDPPHGFVVVKLLDQGAVFKPASATRSGGARVNGHATSPAPRGTARGTDWGKEAAAMASQLSAEALTDLAKRLGVSESALVDVGCGWAAGADLRRLRASGTGWKESYPEGAYCFPERDGSGRVVGLSLRAPDGRKGAPAGAARGLIVPTSFPAAPDPVLIVEGASDAAACLTLGLSVVGRPSNSGGAEALASMLEGRKVVVVGERDQKAGGDWPGRKGAKSVAGHVSAEWEEPVPWTLPPSGTKDVRAWLLTRIANGLDLGNAEACKAAGAELLSAVVSAQRTTKPKRERPPRDAELLVRLSEERYRLGKADGDLAFAVKLDGPNVAIPLKGTNDALRAALAKDFREKYKRTPCASALTDAMVALLGKAQDSNTETIGLRVAEHEGGVVIDLGGANGQAVLIRPGGWEVLDSSPVLFRRTALTAPLPVPLPGGSLDQLRELLNVTDATWPVALGWLVSCLIPAIPHPVLMLGGLQGTGKTTAAVFMTGLFDPSTAENHNVPRDPESWAMAANGSWSVVVDNVSAVSEWWSDALCKAVTGTGWIKRAHFTNSDLTVLHFRRAVILTSIDAGALRGDLADRLVMVELEKIPPERRREDAELRRLYRKRQPAIVGALLDLVAAVLQVLPTVDLESKPRMADFAKVLAAMDVVLGTDALGLYLEQLNQIAHDVVAGDPVGDAVAAYIIAAGEWIGPAKQLWVELTPTDRRPDGWPRTPRGMGGRLKRLTPALAALGIQVIAPEKTDKTRRYTLRYTAPTAQPPAVSLPEDGGAPSPKGVQPSSGAPSSGGDGLGHPGREPEPDAPVGLSGGSGDCPPSESGNAPDDEGDWGTA